MNEKALWFPRTTPWEAVDGELMRWSDEVRGAKPSQEETSRLVRWLLGKDDELSLAMPRAIQVYFRWLDDTLMRPPKRVSRKPFKDVMLGGELERFVRALKVTYESDGRERTAFDEWVEEHSLAWMIDRESTVRDRWKTLRTLWVAEEWSDEPLQYLTEVIDAYLFGCDRASIALCRSVCELLLKRRFGIPAGSELGLGELIRRGAAERVLVGRNFRFARKVNDVASRVIHPGTTVDLAISSEILKLTADLLEALTTRGKEL